MAQRTSPMDEQDEGIETAVAALLDVAIVVRRIGNIARADCKMCGQQDERHTDACPIPALEQWLFDAGKADSDQPATVAIWSKLGLTPN